MFARVMTFPWEAPPDEPACPHGVPLHQDCHKCGFTTDDLVAYAEEIGMEEPPAPSLADTVAAIQADMRFAVRHTAVLVRSDNALLRMVVNTERGQAIPPGKCVFKDGSAIEFQDIGMPQPGMPLMTVPELVKAAFSKAVEIGLEIA